MSLRKVVAVFAVLVLVGGSVASATTYNLRAVVSNAWTPAFGTQVKTGGGPYPPSPTPTGGPQTFVQLPTATIYQVDFYINIANLTAGMRGFGNLALNIGLTGGGLSQSSDLPGWQPDSHFTDTNGGAPAGSSALWFANADGGTSGDLQGILATIAAIPAPTATDLLAKIGIVGTLPAAFNAGTPNVNQFGWADGNTFIGSLYVNYTGQGNASLAAVLTGGSNAGADGTLIADAGAVLNGATVNFIPVPEPGTFVLMGLGVLGMVGLKLRRRS
jgi:hypothetical protein